MRGWKTSFTLSMRPSAKQASTCSASRCGDVGILLFLLIFFGAASTKTGFGRSQNLVLDHATLSRSDAGSALDTANARPRAAFLQLEELWCRFHRRAMYRHEGRLVLADQ